MHINNAINSTLKSLEQNHNLRHISDYTHNDVYLITESKEALLNFASNDYLGLAKDKALKEKFLSQIQCEDSYFSSSSSRLLSGGFPAYRRLETRLSRIYNKSALIFNSGYHCNISCIQALSTLPNSIFFVDRLIHASVIDGLQRARFRRFKHNDINDISALVASHKHYQHIIIVSEGLFSMDGDFAPLEGLISLKNTYPQILLYLDEAHSIGVSGKNQLGLGYEKRQNIDFIVIPFGKALASMGAAMLCQNNARTFFINFARGLIYSTALPAINIAWSDFIWEYMLSCNLKPKMKHLANLSKYLKAQAMYKGYDVRGEAQILSIMCGDNQKAIALANQLRQKGIFAPAIKEPTVPKGSARIRICLNANMNLAHIDQLINAL